MAELPARVRCRGGSRVCRGGRALGSAWAGPRPSERPRLGHVAGSVGACGSPGARSPAVLEPQRLAAQALNPTLPFGEVGFDPLLSEERRLLGVLLPPWALRQLQVQKTRFHLSQAVQSSSLRTCSA